ncbi:Hsp20/alpha crystallin family protein [Chloroflexota bacterium]
MSMIRWEPFREMMSMKNAMDRLFEESFVRPSRLWLELARGESPLDMYQPKDDVLVKAALPGVKPEEVKISITEDTLTIKGEHKKEQEVKEGDYFCKEHHYGAFSRSVTMPVLVKSNKTEEIKPRQIELKTNTKSTTKEIT